MAIDQSLNTEWNLSEYTQRFTKDLEGRLQKSQSGKIIHLKEYVMQWLRRG